MGDPLSVIASTIAIADFLKDAYRFAKDVLKADDERQDFESRLQCVGAIRETLDVCIAGEKDQPGQPWVKHLDPSIKGSPLAGLEDTLGRMRKLLVLKKTTFRQKLKNFKWHSEKKDLEEFFVAIDGYYTRIMVILGSATMGLTRESFTFTKAMAAGIEDERKETKRWREETERKEIEGWLSPLDFQARQREIYADSAKTGNWFLDLPEFQYWKNGDVDVLRCYGDPGAGKTVLSSVAVNHLIASSTESYPVLCMYLEKKPRYEHNKKNLLGSLLKQLLQASKTEITPSIKVAYENARRINARATFDEITALFKAEVDRNCYSKVYITVDGLDELIRDPDPSICPRNFIENELRQLSPLKIRLLTTTRLDEMRDSLAIVCDYCEHECIRWYHCTGCPQSREARVDVCEKCHVDGKGCPNALSHDLKLVTQKDVEVTLSMPIQDLRAYVQSLIENKMPTVRTEDGLSSAQRGCPPGSVGWECHKDKKLFERVLKAIPTAARGRFLLAKQYTRSLASKKTLKAIKRALTDIENDRYDISATIDRLWEEDMRLRIMGPADKENVEIAMRIMSIVSTTRRNLKYAELVQLLATESGDNSYDPEGQLSQESIRNLTKGLIRIDGDKDATVRLDHRTLEEYLNKTKHTWFPRAEIELASTCLIYLSFEEFSKPCEDFDEFALKEKSHPFISYAVQYWGDHLYEAGAELDTAAIEYLSNADKIAAYIQSAWAADTSEHDKWDVRKRIHPYHICAWFDLGRLISQLNYQTTLIDIPEGTYGQTSLMYACRRGNVDIARYLLGLGASVNACSDKGRTPLFEAVLRNKIEIVHLLLNPELRGKEIDPKAVNIKSFSRTALMTAIDLGNSDIALAVLEHSHASINMEDLEGSTALSLACYMGLTRVVEAILNIRDVDINHQEKIAGRSPLILAAESNHCLIVKQLLVKGADPNLKDSMGSTAASRAVAEGNLEALEAMLDYEVDLFSLDEEKRSLLHLAADESHINILELLHKKGLSVNSPDEIGMTALHCACRAGDLEVTKTILSMGADITAIDHYERTPADVARQYGHAKLTHLFPGIDGGSVDSTDDSLSDFPLWSLVTLRRLDLIQSLISRNKADFSILEPGTRRTALHCAIHEPLEGTERTHNLQILEELLKANINILDNVDRNLQTALHLAAAYNNTEAVTKLLEHDPDINAVDRFGLTPLIIAYKNNKTDLAIALLEADACIDVMKIGLQKLLFAAIQFPSSRAVQNLIKAGADVLAQDEYGRTALQIAKKSSDKNILNMVQSMNSFYHQVKRIQTKAEITVQISTLEVVDGTDEEVQDEMFDLNMPIRTFQSRIVDLSDMPTIPSNLPDLPTKVAMENIAVYV